jgi:IclR family pca regulon transcriptional regulator
VQRAFAILEAFSPTEPRMTLQQVADKIGLPKVTSFRYLRTLTALGYITKEPDSNGYRLDPKILRLGFTVLAGMELRQTALTHLQELSRIAGQNVGLGVVDKTEVVYVERIKRKHIINVDYGVGSRINMYRTSAGRAILAFMGRAEMWNLVKKILEEDRSAADEIGATGDKLSGILEQVRRQGYATNNEEFISGLRAIGAPLFDGRGIVEGAINIVVFSHEVSQEDLVRDYLPLLLDTARKISSARGHTDPNA